MQVLSSPPGTSVRNEPRAGIDAFTCRGRVDDPRPHSKGSRNLLTEEVKKRFNIFTVKLDSQRHLGCFVYFTISRFHLPPFGIRGKVTASPPDMTSRQLVGKPEELNESTTATTVIETRSWAESPRRLFTLDSGRATYTVWHSMPMHALHGTYQSEYPIKKWLLSVAGLANYSPCDSDSLLSRGGRLLGIRSDRTLNRPPRASRLKNGGEQNRRVSYKRASCPFTSK